ncbi:MAG: 16S rRNA (cytidine(1402)-2'-O)-methyltransferase, partial [Bacilli bacterium]|nr:16S rRNA (cytidine(1402)-2'-O)-methyltransferase [Bacilli bacterium]
MKRELNFEGPSPLLYLIATPIGNLQELSPRAKDVLMSMDYLSAEDTRNSGRLMAHFGIDKPWVSCHEHNEEHAAEQIIALLQQGKKVAYMSDAGYPGLSDPGQRLVAKCLDNGIKVSVVSGPSAAINALVCSGLESDHFYFEGFLPPKEGERNAELLELAKRKETLIFYEAPHRIVKTLIAMAATLGDRKAVIARELTKAHEEFLRGTLSELALESEESLRGEMVIIVEGNKEKHVVTDNDLAAGLRTELDWGRSSKEAIANVAKNFGVPKSRVYDLYLK